MPSFLMLTILTELWRRKAPPLLPIENIDKFESGVVIEFDTSALQVKEEKRKSDEQFWLRWSQDLQTLRPKEA